MSRAVSVTDTSGVSRHYPRASEVEVTSDGALLLLAGPGGLIVALYPLREVSRVEVEEKDDDAGRPIKPVQTSDRPKR